MTRPVRARINLQALQHNFNRVRQFAPNSKIMAIIKANAYGHGLVRVAQVLPDADAFGVACLEEAITLREAGFDRRIVLLEGLFDLDDLILISGYRLDVVIHHVSQIELLEQGPVTRSLNVWLKLDTGMHRLGFEPESVAAVSKRLKNIPQLAELNYMTHLPVPMCRVMTTPRHNSVCLMRHYRQLTVRVHWPIPQEYWVGPPAMPTGCVPALCSTAVHRFPGRLHRRLI